MIIKKTILVFFVLLSSSIYSKNVGKTIQIGKITGVQFSNCIDVVLIKGDKESLRIVCEEKEHKNIVAKSRNEFLEVSYKGSDEINFLTKKKAKIYFTYVYLSILLVDNYTKISSKNNINLPVLTLGVSTGSLADLTVNIKDFTLSASKGGKITLRGETTNMLASCSDGIEVNADKLKSNDVIANISKGAILKVNVIKNLKAIVSSGARLLYNGYPKEKDIKMISGGIVLSSNMKNKI